MTILVFDIETVPDFNAGCRLYQLKDLSKKDIAQAMMKQRLQETDGRTDFLRPHLQQVVAISVVLKTTNQLKVWSLGDSTATEQELVERFFEGIEQYTPTLVSWNGSGFDLPVLHYRALLHGISAPRYWDTGDNDRDFKWNNYLSRYHSRHTDLMDVLSSYTLNARAPLDELATILGFPGKMGMAGDKVLDCYLADDVSTIRNYCETDVLNTYLVYLRYQLICGNYTESTYQAAVTELRECLMSKAEPHLTEFLTAWDAAPKE